MSKNWENFTKKRPTSFPKNFHKTSGVSFLPNPGNYSSLYSRTKDITPQWIDGIELGYKHKLSPNCTFFSNWIWSHTFPSGFRAGGNFCYQIKDNVIVRGSSLIEFFFKNLFNFSQIL